MAPELWVQTKRPISMTLLEEKYAELLGTPSDVNYHFETIRKYVAPGDRVVELGVRECVSTYALMINKPSALISVDIIEPSNENLDAVKAAAKEAGIDFRFYQGDSVYIDIKPIDILFLDTLHLYSQIVKELWRHSGRTSKYIIFHDSLIPEVRACIQDFLFNLDWKLVEENQEGTGLAIVERIKRV